MTEPHDDQFDDQFDAAELGEIEALLHELNSTDLDAALPPEEVWAGIATALANDASTAVSEPPPGEHLAPPIPLLPGRRARTKFTRTTWLAVAAAAAGLVIAGVAIASRGPSTVVTATATLTWDPTTFDPAGADASAIAELVERDGRFELTLRDTRLPSPDSEAADLELWLIAVDESGVPSDIAPIALVAASAPGTYVIPDGVDPTVNTIVDISIEPRDGDEQHSGRSILRGPLV